MNPSLAKYAQMQTVDMKPVIAFMVREGASQSEAEMSVQALLQWLAGHAVLEHERPYVMLHGPVDKAFHAFILNTKLYYRFCQKHVGWFINHTPLDAQQAVESEIVGGIRYTAAFLEAEFGDFLHPLLQQWVKDAREGLATVSAVSCVGNGYGDIRKEEFMVA